MNPRFLDDAVPFNPPAPIYFARHKGHAFFVKGTYEELVKHFVGDMSVIEELFLCGPEQKVVTSFAAK